MRRPPNQTGQGNRNIILKASRNDRRSDLPALGGALAPVQPQTTRHAGAAERGFASIGLVQFRKIVVKTITEVMTGADDDAERLSPLGWQEGILRATRFGIGAIGGVSAARQIPWPPAEPLHGILASGRKFLTFVP